MKIINGETYVNKKYNRDYIVIKDLVINATNNNDGQEMVLYKLADSCSQQIYAREINEFKVKFYRKNVGDKK